MILADASVWIHHLRSADGFLQTQLLEGRILMHPFVVGELALGNLKDRERRLEKLRDLPQAPVAEHEEVLTMIERQNLQGRGIGYVDAHLLAAVLVLRKATLWTRDKRLHEAARQQDVAFVETLH